ncbi:DUF4238 domain-containing protein [Fibrella aquatilis]|uniref:DUF4238 domain-containing protein n=1 Tax=Fibrella aquatilis TaxID=2817059 RepID=A0A939G588_9BACT|nr:DUF4238 domain-containing protein [Fibrella aquatilis]MBO0930467.1 DUF4238 domain-containing protein [Fibrella aquatilis]
MEYKKNHTIPKAVLKHWVITKDEREGVFVYDIIKGKQYFSSSKGKSAFSFAISSDLYVPTIDGIRNVDMELWKSGLEDTIAPFIDKLISKNINNIAKDRTHLAKILTAIFVLDYSSKHRFDIYLRFIKENPELKENISGKPERDDKVLALENIINTISEEVNSYVGIEFTVMTSDDDHHFIYCDHPLIHRLFDDDDVSFIVLTNKIVLAFKNAANSTILHMGIKPEFVDAINKVMALYSRRWIVASKESDLEKYKDVIESTEWADLRAKDEAEYALVKYLPWGSYFSNGTKP